MKGYDSAAFDSFHDHVDMCVQCREHPFALCIRGFQLLQAALPEGTTDGNCMIGDDGAIWGAE